MSKKKPQSAIPRWRITRLGRIFYTYGATHEDALRNAINAGITGGDEPIVANRDGEYDRATNTLSGASDLAEEVIETWTVAKRR